MLDVRRMRVLREVAAQRSFSAAAEKLGYTQSAVSQQIAALEREAGATLIERNPRGMRLTDAGEALVRHADTILVRLAEAEAELDAIAGLRGGRLRLASFPTAGATLMPEAVADFSKRHPGVELSLAESEPDESLLRLKAGELDLALVDDGPPVRMDDEEVDYIDLLEDPLYLGRPAGHAPPASLPGPRGGGLDPGKQRLLVHAPAPARLLGRRLRAAGGVRERRLRRRAGPRGRRGGRRADPGTRARERASRHRDPIDRREAAGAPDHGGDAGERLPLAGHGRDARDARADRSRLRREDAGAGGGLVGPTGAQRSVSHRRVSYCTQRRSAR
ncbi:MAG: LysR family transcriptional regulator [Actinobacteria bacterium]|nr:MAG: LysR family transcriptional regulator [Actinomycetota bacterium]